MLSLSSSMQAKFLRRYKLEDWSGVLSKNICTSHWRIMTWLDPSISWKRGWVIQIHFSVDSKFHGTKRLLADSSMWWILQWRRIGYSKIKFILHYMSSCTCRHPDYWQNFFMNTPQIFNFGWSIFSLWSSNWHFWFSRCMLPVYNYKM